MIIILVSLLLMILAMRAAAPPDRPVVGMLTISAAYYTLGAYFYWISYSNGIFVLRQWPIEDLVLADQIIAITAATLAFIIAITGRTDRATLTASALVPSHFAKTRSPWTFWVMVAVGLLCSLFVLKEGSFGTGAWNRSSFFLVAYQFSDVLIPALCYRIARRGLDRATLAMLGYFTVYTVMVGFRYKLALVGIPLIFSFAYADLRPQKKYLIAGISGLAFICLFSLMTLYRSKFGIPDFTKPLDHPGQRLALGLFAETNIVYGLATVIAHNVRENVLHPLQPLLDSGKELLPKFLFPDRDTGLYLRDMMLGFGTKEGIQSLTAYPWIGEFMLMFGWAGLVLGPVCLAVLYRALQALLRITAVSQREWAFGLFLIAGVVGYYQFGRGYAPQMTKAYLFVIAPYFILCMAGAKFRLGSRGGASARSSAIPGQARPAQILHSTNQAE